MDGRPEDLGVEYGPKKKRTAMNSVEKTVDSAENIVLTAASHTLQGFMYAMWIGGAISLAIIIVFGIAIALGK